MKTKPQVKKEAPGFKQLIKGSPGKITMEEARFLYEEARKVTIACIVEVGSYRGRSAVALGLGSMAGHNVPVFAIDPHENWVGAFGGKYGPSDRGCFFRAMLQTKCFKVVRLVNLRSEIVTPGWRKPVSLLWLDGDHAYDSVMADLVNWKPHLTKDAVVLLDDTRGKSMGPHILVNDLIAVGEFRFVKRVGKVTKLVREKVAPQQKEKPYAADKKPDS